MCFFGRSKSSTNLIPQPAPTAPADTGADTSAMTDEQRRRMAAASLPTSGPQGFGEMGLATQDLHGRFVASQLTGQPMQPAGSYVNWQTGARTLPRTVLGG